jgi:hypothetical protein
VINAAYANGLTLIARLDYVPEWARPPNSSPKLLTAFGQARFVRFVERFVERYRDRVQHYLIWNEPNLTIEWGFQPVSPAGYTALLRESYAAVKRAAPSATVIAAGLAPNTDQSAAALDELIFLQQMYDAGAAPYFDALAAHVYGGRLPPDDPPAPDRVNFARVELLRAVMARNGDQAKKILITEGGWNDSPRWTRAVRPAQRVQYTVRALEKAHQEWPWVEAVSFWMFRLPRPARNYNDYFTFVDQAFRPKPIYRAVQAFAFTP